MLVSNTVKLRAEPAPAPAATPVWCSDRGNGMYWNPVLFADYSDPDAIRVGEDYWLTSSSFCHVPGLPILHSRDLVNWTLVNHALPRLVPEDHFSRPRHGGGVWAPSIRHHAGKFWIFYPDPDFGIYVITADDPRAAWSAPVMVKAGRGLIDPCPFWDDDGAAYLIHGWAKSRAGIKNRLTLHRLNGAGTEVTDAGEVVIDGDRMPGWNTIEGPKLYKRGGYYYVFAPAGGVSDGYQAVFRARNIRGPYESRIVLAQGATPVNGPHQGAWIDTPEGNHWFLHFQEQPAYGRIVHLQPVRWVDDWPLMGGGDHTEGPGEPVRAAQKPRALAAAPSAPAASDEFDAPVLGRQWQWQANPRPEWFSLTAAPGALRLACVRTEPRATLWDAAHLVMQKFPAPEFVATTQLAFSPAADGDCGGLVVFGHDYAWLGLRRENGALRLVLVNCRSAHQGGGEREMASIDFAGDFAVESIQLRVSVWPGAVCRFSYCLEGGAFQSLGQEFQARSSYWVGAKVGLFASANGGSASAGQTGHLDTAWFHITPPPA